MITRKQLFIKALTNSKLFDIKDNGEICCAIDNGQYVTNELEFIVDDYFSLIEENQELGILNNVKTTDPLLQIKSITTDDITQGVYSTIRKHPIVINLTTKDMTDAVAKGFESYLKNLPEFSGEGLSQNQLRQCFKKLTVKPL